MQKYKLRDLINIHNGSDYKHLMHGNIPLYGSGGLMGYVNDFLYDGEAILLPRKGTLDNILYVNGKFWTVDTMYYSTVHNEVDAYYLYCYLSLLDLSHLDSGSALPSMTKSAYYDVEVKLPDYSIQKQISSILSSLDKKIELNNKINQKLEAMAKMIYEYWFVQFDFPDANGKPYKSSGGKMIYNEELKREIPEGWGVKKFEDLADIIGGSTPSKAEPNNFSSSAIPWLTPKDLSLNTMNKFISRGAIDVTDAGVRSASLRMLPKGTILLTTRAPVGYMAIARNPVTTNQGFKSFVPKSNLGYTSEYLYYLIKVNMDLIKKNASGSTFKEISGSVIKSLKTVSAPKQIIDEYTKIIKPIFDKQNLLEQENHKLTWLRDWLLPMLMNGQVKVLEAANIVGEALMAAEPKVEYGKG